MGYLLAVSLLYVFNYNYYKVPFDCRSTATAGAIHQTLVREEVDTMAKMLQFVVRRYGARRALGTRQILAEEDEVQPSGRVFKKVC